MNIERVTATTLSPQRQPAREGAPAPGVGERLALRFEGRDGQGLMLRNEQGARLHLPSPGPWAHALSVGETVWMRVLATHPSLELEFVAPSPGRPSAPGAPDDVAAMRPDQAAQRTHRWRLPSPAELVAAWRVILASRHMEVGLQGLALMERQPLALPGAAAPAGAGRSPDDIAEPGHWSFHLYAWGGLNVTLRVAARTLWERRKQPRDEGVQGLEIAITLPEAGGPLTVQLLCVSGGLAMALLPRQPQVLPLLRSVLPEMAAAIGRAGMPLVKVQLGTPLSPLPRGGLNYRPGAASPILLNAAAEVVSGLAQHWPVPPDA